MLEAYLGPRRADRAEKRPGKLLEESAELDPLEFRRALLRRDGGAAGRGRSTAPVGFMRPPSGRPRFRRCSCAWRSSLTRCSISKPSPRDGRISTLVWPGRSADDRHRAACGSSVEVRIESGTPEGSDVAGDRVAPTPPFVPFRARCIPHGRPGPALAECMIAGLGRARRPPKRAEFPSFFRAGFRSHRNIVRRFSCPHERIFAPAGSGRFRESECSSIVFAIAAGSVLIVASSWASRNEARWGSRQTSSSRSAIPGGFNTPDRAGLHA